MKNSLILTVASVALIVFVCSMVAFVHQRRKDRLSSLVSILLLAGLIIPPAVVPTIFVLQALGLFKTLTRPDPDRPGLCHSLCGDRPAGLRRLDPT